ncbi:MAG: SUMF1/EgtB/PvdO family nonheme iron enzyme [Thermoguttaceae bacterium]|nr:SUMF1/EgtB/PvdO family nonheme iron enzyme [Thermoguttaceae bacterium]
MSETPMKKQALLIGINEYQILPGLKYARQDAEAVADSLKQNYCFSDNEVMVLTDARPGLFKPSNRMIIRKHLENLASQDLDLFIFGFWGHGLFRNGERFLCPQDVMGDAVEEMGVSFKDLQRLLSNVRAKNTCLILDCCQTIHDRGEAETLTVSDQTTMENAARDIVLRRKEQIPDFQSNVAILNSCKEGQSAYEWDERQHGLFTAHLLDAMKKRSNSVMQIASYISSNIEKTALELGKEQTPFYKLEGDIVLPVETKSTPLVTGDVFISYRHCNADLVAPIEAELNRRGISYFIDRVGINYSMDYSTVIARAIKACKVLLVVWTKEANDSPDMLREVVTASNLKKSVLPYKLGRFNELEHDALYLQLSTLSRCDAVAPTPDSVTELVNRIQLLLDPSAPIPPVSIPQPKPEPTKSGASGSGSKMSEFLQKKKNQLESDALEALENGNYEQAITKLEFLLNLDPDSAVAKKLMALCKLALEKRNKPNNASSSLKAGDRKTVTVNGVEFAFRWCPRGTFMMGSPTSEEGRYDNETQHQVTLTKGFWMMKTEVTQKQWKAVMGSNPSHFQGDDLPVEQVSWNNCQEFCKKCAQLGFPVQLPTEAQWEYACRAGTTGAYAGNLDDMAWYSSNSGSKTHPVGTKKPNAWGLYDMHGNVWEWCADWYDDYPSGSVTDLRKLWTVNLLRYDDYLSGSVTDPTGPSSGDYRVVRGGSWFSDVGYCRSAKRYLIDPGSRSDDLGFRLVKGQ